MSWKHRLKLRPLEPRLSPETPVRQRLGSIDVGAVPDPSCHFSAEAINNLCGRSLSIQMHIRRFRNRNGVVTTLVGHACHDPEGQEPQGGQHGPPAPRDSPPIERQLRGQVLIPSSAFETESVRGHSNVDAVVKTHDTAGYRPGPRRFKGPPRNNQAAPVSNPPLLRDLWLRS